VKQPVILFRDSGFEDECIIAETTLPVVKYRSAIPPNSLVIGRYSVLPCYKELEDELAQNGSRLINSYRQHQFIADIMEWAGPGGILEGLTPKTWTEWGHLPEGQYVVKGRTNSRKHQWRTHMYAPNKAAIATVAQRLLDDSLIGEQGLVVREYIPLRQLAEGLNGLPITNEWRTFWMNQNGMPYLVGYGFYWSSHPELADDSKFTHQGFELARQAAKLLVSHVNFFVLDVAETAEGDWIVIEVNDGQMSGTGMCNNYYLYSAIQNLHRRAIEVK